MTEMGFSRTLTGNKYFWIMFQHASLRLQEREWRYKEYLEIFKKCFELDDPPIVIWRETAAQHFNGPDGDFWIATDVFRSCITVLDLPKKKQVCNEYWNNIPGMQAEYRKKSAKLKMMTLCLVKIRNCFENASVQRILSLIRRVLLIQCRGTR